MANQPVANLTVAIATLRRPRSLARCLDALLAAEMLPAEVIVVDQSRDEATQSVVERRRGAGMPLVYVRQEQRGLSVSRNAAIANATQPVIAFTDDDCVPDNSWVAVANKAFSTPPSPDGLTGRVLPLGPQAPGTYAVSARDSTTRRDIRGKVVPWLVGTGGNFVAKRECFQLVGLYDNRLGAGSPGKAAEDADMFYRLLCAGACIRYDPASVVYHARQSEAQLLSSCWNYGFGIGALCGIWLRQQDRYMIRVLGFWSRYLCRKLAGALVHTNGMQVREPVLSLRGTARGLLYGWRLNDGSMDRQEKSVP
jgi:glycosyltransferase involved in cell wall biosynthesis